MSRALRTAQSMEGEALASQAQCELRRFGRQKLPLNVRNSVEGSRYLIEAVERCCAKYRIAKSHVLFGGEDPPEYVRNFVDSVQARGYAFVRVNAREAKKHRTNTRATSDALALDGISQVMLLHRAYDLVRWDEIYGAMKLAERSRRRLKSQETALKNRIYRTVELREGKSRLSTAKKIIRVSSAMVRDERGYLPPGALAPSAPEAMPAEQFAAYLEIVGEMLKRKRKRYDLSGIPDERNRLVRWLEDTGELVRHSRRNNNK